MTKTGRDIDQDLIRELARLVNQTDLSEIEVEQEGLRIRVARTITAAPVAAAPVAAAPVATVPVAAPAAAAPAAAQPAQAAPAQAASSEAEQKPGTVTSPMVGTAYRAPEPGAQPFIEVGASVDAGQTVLIVEAMKTMNPIPAPKAGTVTAILVDDAQPVEYGEPLLVIE